MSVTDPLEITSDSPEQTQSLAAQLAMYCDGPACITLSGDLGAGKTCFTQGFIRALAGDVPVQSPTFLLIKPYECINLAQSAPPPIYHMDLYRIEHAEELEELGLEEYLSSGICLIEWADIAKSYFPPDVLEVSIEAMEVGTQRKITIVAKGDWQKRLNNIYLRL